MSRQLPKSLKGFTAFADGRGYLGRVAAGKLPVIKIKTEDYRDGGMDGEVALDFGQEKMELSISLSELNRDFLGLVGRSDTPLTLRGSLEDESGNSEPVVATAFGLVHEGDPGEWKAGEPKIEAKLTMTPDYYRLMIGADVVYEIDLIAGIRRINGVDQLARRRANLGG